MGLVRDEPNGDQVIEGPPSPSTDLLSGREGQVLEDATPKTV